MPLSAAGKVEKAQLREPYWQGQSRRVGEGNCAGPIGRPPRWTIASGYRHGMPSLAMRGCPSPVQACNTSCTIWWNWLNCAVTCKGVRGLKAISVVAPFSLF